MSLSLRERRRASRHRRAIAYWIVSIAMFMSLWIGLTYVPPDWVRTPALLIHLVGVIVGLGAAVVLETTGLLWALRKVTLNDLLRAEKIISPLAWLGILALLASGALLQPDLTQPLTALKMTAVTIAALNGVAMRRMTRELSRLPHDIPFSRLPRGVRIWSLWSATVSQLSWWTAVIIGMLNTASR